MRLLVVGASGGVGRQMVLAGLARGWTVRAWSRFEGELPLSHPRLEHVVGDVTEAARCDDAMREVDAVTCALGSTRGLEPTRVCRDGTRALLTAMRAHGVSKIVAVTSLGTTHKLGPVHRHVFDPYVFAGIYDDKRAQESLLLGSDRDAVIVRPGRLTDAPDRGRARVVFGDGLPGVMVSRAAVARFAIEQVTNDRYVRLPVYLVEPGPRWLPWHKLLTLGADAGAR